MGKIAKVYNSIWIDGNTLTASDTRRAFDEAYDLVNGNLNSENFINININQNGILFSTSTWTSTAITGVIDEVKNKNYHSFHFFAHGADVISAFRGRGFINDKLNIISGRIDMSASNIVYTGGNVTTGSWALLMGAGSSNLITQSDIAITLASNISASLAWNNQKQGYYPAIASGVRRAIFKFIRNVAGASSNLFDHEFLDPPWEGHSYRLTPNEASSVGFEDIGVTQTNGFSIKTITRHYSGETHGYSYWMNGDTPTVSATVGNQILVGDYPNSYWMISDFTFFDNASGVTLGGDRIVRSRGGGCQVMINVSLGNSLYLAFVGTQTLNGRWSGMLHRNNSLFGASAVRG